MAPSPRRTRTCSTLQTSGWMSSLQEKCNCQRSGNRSSSSLLCYCCKGSCCPGVGGSWSYTVRASTHHWSNLSLHSPNLSPTGQSLPLPPRPQTPTFCTCSSKHAHPKKVDQWKVRKNASLQMEPHKSRAIPEWWENTSCTWCRRCAGPPPGS